jgi:inorganic phosphate transporter, PiT family
VVALPIFATSVALGAPIRVMLAARLVFPILTTFSLVGALLGALVLYPLFRLGRPWLGVARNTCVCIGEQVVKCYPEGLSPGAAVARLEAAGRPPQIQVGTKPECKRPCSGQVLGIELNKVIDQLH